MTELQKQLTEKIKQLDREETIYNDHHRRAKRKKQNVIVPLKREVDALLIEVQKERLKRIESQS